MNKVSGKGDSFYIGNEPGSSLTHLLGTFLSIGALVLLIIIASINGNAWHIISFTIFGVSLVLMYLASAIYHGVYKISQWKEFFRVIDHSMIFVLIAGTYTPVCLVILKGGWGWALFGIVWGVTLIGILLKIFYRTCLISKLAPLVYLMLGWLIVIRLPQIVRLLSDTAIFWLVLGGVLYTVGTIFFGLGVRFPKFKWFGYHEIFHLFVMFGSFAHFWFMLRYVVYIN